MIYYVSDVIMSLNFDMVILTSIFIIITSISILIIMYFFKKIIGDLLVDVRNRQLENRSIISGLRKEISTINTRIGGIISDIDSLTTRVYKLESQIFGGEKTPQKSLEEPEKVKPLKPVSPSKRILSGLTRTEAKILELLTAGPKSSREIRDTLGLSREHVARELKSLYEKGYVIRYTDSKPYVYEITESGLNAIKTS